MAYENYETNLKLYLDTIKQDFNIILTSTIPTQKNLIKTILWLNITFIATSLTIFKFFKTYNVIMLLSLPFVFSSIAIGITLLALLKGRNKAFAHPKLEVVTSLIETPDEKIQFLLDLINSYETAIINNAKIVEQRAKNIHYATFFTILSGISIILVIILIANMAI